VNIDPGTRVLTSTAGRFFFSTDVLLSHAKLVRDTVTASFHGCGNGTGKLPKPTAIQRWFRENVDGPAKDTLFRWEPIQVR
jgi:hypothetical protein